MLPAYVVANDRGFHEKIADIKSPQRGWFWRPEQLADAWKDGEKPRPSWKDESSDSTKRIDEDLARGRGSAREGCTKKGRKRPFFFRMTDRD
ncbi:hypothetical protein WK03_20225 [Burkholderia cepacia]|nr:hypothetical protein WK03_20225 [Burkholderia cepacia]